MTIAGTTRHVTLAASAALLLAIWLGPGAGEAHALECGQSIVIVGDRMGAVEARCGQPTTATTRVETRVEWIVPPSPGFPGQSRTVTVEIVVWTYDFGPGRYIEELEFRDGVLTRMRSLGPSRRR